jgi:hypothetical protein
MIHIKDIQFPSNDKKSRVWFIALILVRWAPLHSSARGCPLHPTTTSTLFHLFLNPPPAMPPFPLSLQAFSAGCLFTSIYVPQSLSSSVKGAL